MSLAEFLLEAERQYAKTPEAEQKRKLDKWTSQLELTDEEWRAQYGTSQS